MRARHEKKKTEIKEENAAVEEVSLAEEEISLIEETASPTEEDSVTVEVLPRKCLPLQLGMSSIMGTRSSQQDSIFGHVDEKGALGIVCDGMGGLTGGEFASRTAVESLAEAWFSREEIADIPAFLEEEALNADEKVFQLENDEGEPLQAGTTIVAVVIRDNELYWLSVGDSKIYIIRGNEILAVSREHNYRMTLDQKLKQGEITPEEYSAEEYRAEALISYIGMGNVFLIDVNRKPFLLEDEDIIILSSDGLYRSLSEQEILRIARKYARDMQICAQNLTVAALGDKQSGQDNTSVVALRYDKKQNNTEMEEDSECI